MNSTHYLILSIACIAFFAAYTKDIIDDATKYSAIKLETFKPIKLESSILAIIDGNFMNASIIELVLSYKRDLICILFGEKDAHDNRIGHYPFNGTLMTAYDIACAEETWHKNNGTPTPSVIAQRDEQLKIIKTDFLTCSKKLKVIAAGVKAFMGALIKQSCERRGRSNSILNLWAITPEEKEDAIFDEQVKTVGSFCTFCFDLIHFMEDLISSCPKARALFEERVTKWKKFVQVLHETLNGAACPDGFLMHVKLHCIDKLKLTDITSTRVSALLDEFRKNHSRMHTAHV